MKGLANYTAILGLLLQTGFGAAQSSSTSAVSAAETQRVTVGATGLTFSPDTITADEGDVIEFVISSGHSVTESNFDSPCQPISGAGIFSGFPANNAVFSVTVNSSDTVWLYCAAPGHCEAGMAMVINPPSTGNTLTAYKKAASSVSSSNAPAAVQGGVFGAASSQHSTSASSAPTSTATSTATAAGAGGYSSGGLALLSNFGLLSMALVGAMIVSL